MDIRNELAKIQKKAEDTIPTVPTGEELERLRTGYLGRKGTLTGILRSIKELSPEERKTIGKTANEIKKRIEKRFEERKRELKTIAHDAHIKKEWLDVTRPGTKTAKGHLHPMTRVLDEINDIFVSMGFAIVEGPEVETEYYNFDALNIPAHHPSRDMWDTFWLHSNQQFSIFNSQLSNPKEKPSTNKSNRLLLRTHTSPVQIRYMETHNPPIRIVVPGRVYRYEATDATHEIQFYQAEGLMVEKNISIANFKAVIKEFFSRLFRKEVEIRLRPSYFPFTEPSFEVDMTCILCAGKKCSVCKGAGWLEMMGAGMVHPHVFKAAGYNPAHHQGFAFGVGIDRIVMMKYKIPDVRLFHSGDIRFLKQF